MTTQVERSGKLPDIRDSIRHIIAEMYPNTVFTDVWVQPDMSPYGDEVVKIWAIFDGLVQDLPHPSKPTFGSRVQSMLWDMDLDASPQISFFAKDEARDWRPEGL